MCQSSTSVWWRWELRLVRGAHITVGVAAKSGELLGNYTQYITQYIGIYIYYVYIYTLYICILCIYIYYVYIYYIIYYILYIYYIYIIYIILYILYILCIYILGIIAIHLRFYIFLEFRSYLYTQQNTGSSLAVVREIKWCLLWWS